MIFEDTTLQDPKMNTSVNPISAGSVSSALFFGVFKMYPYIGFQY